MRLSIFIIIMCCPLIANACQCRNQTIENRVLDSDFIFIGMIVESHMEGDNLVNNKLKVVETIIGEPDTLFMTNETIETSLCAKYTSVGQKYVVFGNYGKPLSFSSCSYTQVLDVYGLDGLEKIKETAKKISQPR